MIIDNIVINTLHTPKEDKRMKKAFIIILLPQKAAVRRL